jgi:hypothetical protein
VTIKIPAIMASSLQGQVEYRESALISALSVLREGKVDDLAIRQIEGAIETFVLLSKVFDPEKWKEPQIKINGVAI